MTTSSKLEAYGIEELFILRWQYSGTLSKDYHFLINGRPLARPLLGVCLQDGADYLLIAPLPTLPRQCKVEIIDDGKGLVAGAKRLKVNPFETFPLNTLGASVRQRIWKALLQQSVRSFPSVTGTTLASMAKRLAVQGAEWFELDKDRYCIRIDWPDVRYVEPGQASVTLLRSSGERINKAAQVLSIGNLLYCVTDVSATERRALVVAIVEAGAELFVPLLSGRIMKADGDRLPIAKLREALLRPAPLPPAGSEVPKTRPLVQADSRAAPARTAQGHALGQKQFDADMRLTDDGFLSGWIKERGQSQAAVRLGFYVDNQFAGDTLANLPLQDESAASSSIGAHGFRFKLPDSLFDGNPHAIAVTEARHGLTSVIARFTYRFTLTPEWLDGSAKLETDIVGRLQLTVETLIPMADNRVFLSGWLIEPEAGLQALVLVDGGRIVHPDLRPHSVAVPRPDVYEKLRVERELANAELGFFCVVRLQGESLQQRFRNCVLYAVTKAREVVRYQLNDKAVDYFRSQPALSQVKSILAIAQAVNDKGKVLEQLGPVVRDVWSSRALPVLQPDVTVFGSVPAQPLVSIIVPLYGRYDFVKYQLALFANDPDIGNQELIYVNDDPRMQSALADMCRAWAPVFKVPFKLVSSGHNLGYAGANNFGVRHANGRYLLLLNSDVMPRTPGWLGGMLTAIESIPKAGAIAPILLYEDDSVQHAGIKFEPYSNWGGLWINDHPGKGQPLSGTFDDRPMQVQAVSGACLMLCRKLYDEVGGLDENYIQGDFEDSDLCLKLLQAGHPSYLIPNVQLYHLERQSIGLTDHVSLRSSVTAYNCWLHSMRWDNVVQALAKAKAEANVNRDTRRVA